MLHEMQTASVKDLNSGSQVHFLKYAVDITI